MHRKLFNKELLLKHGKGVIICLLTALLMAAYLFLRVSYPITPITTASYRAMMIAGGILCILLFVFAYVSIGVYRIKLHLVAAVLIPVLGLLYCQIVPIGAVPDEWSHVHTVYRVSNILMGIDESGLGDGELLMRVDDARATIDPWDETADYNAIPHSRAAYEEYWLRLGTPLEDGNLTVREGAHLLPLSVYPPHQYLAPALGVTMGRILGMGTFDMLLMGRLMSLVIYTLVFVWAMYLMPVYKELLLLIALTPISVQQSMSFSYDSFTDAAAWWCIAMALHLIYRMPEEKRRRMLYYLLLAMGTVLVALAKQKAYIIFIVLLPYVLYRNGLIKPKMVRIAFICLGVAVAAGAVAFLVWRRSLSGAAPLNVFITNNMFRLKGLYVGYVDYMGDLLTQLIGRKMGAANISASYSAWVLYIPLLVMGMMQKRSQETVLSKEDRACFAGIFLFTTAGIMVIFYTISSRNNELFVNSIQGRYILPILPPFLMSLSSRRLIAEDDTTAFTVPAAIVLNFLMMFSVMTYMEA